MGLKKRTDFTDEHVYQAYLRSEIAEATKKAGGQVWHDSPSEETQRLEKRVKEVGGKKQ